MTTKLEQALKRAREMNDLQAALKRVGEAKYAESALIFRRGYNTLLADAKLIAEQLKEAHDALREICEPTTPDYYLGVRCGLEDRDLQSDPYAAAEYGYDAGKDYCQFIAAQALPPQEDA